MNRYQVGLLAVVAVIIAAAIFAAGQPIAETSPGAPVNSGTANTEGDYDKTERAIVSLLGAGGTVAAEALQVQDSLQTPELYAGSARSDGRIGLHGSWQDHVQYVEATGPASVQLVFHAREVYIVAEAAGSQPLSVTAMLDGKPVPDPERGPDLDSNGTLTVSRSDLFHVLTGTGGSDRTIVLGVPSGFRLYTFTFG